MSSGMHGFPNSDAAPLLEAMLVAYREGDGQAFSKCCDDTIFKSMDNEVSLVAWDCVTHSLCVVSQVGP